MNKHAFRSLSQLATLVTVLLFGLACSAAAQPGSDYETVKSFQTKYKAIKEAIRQASTVQQCAEISADIDELQKEFASDTTLLNKALYPNKYDDEIDNARVDLQMTQNRLGIIESQVARITDLETQVRVLSGKVDSLSEQNDKLMASLDAVTKALERHKDVVDSLNRIISQLRKGIRERDAAIFSMVDSMFTQYGKNVQELPEQERAMLIGKMRRHNAVQAIRQAAEQNLKFLETTQLSGKDLVQMLAEQHKFMSYWQGLGPKLTSLYVNRKDQKAQIIEIDTAISQWGQKATLALWAGLYGEFAQYKVPVDSFRNADEFTTSLSNYFDTQGGDLKAPATERASRLNYFLNKVWNPSVNSEWIPMLLDRGLISQAQDNQIQNKLKAWEQATKPSYALLYVVIIIIFIAVVIFFVMKNKKMAPPYPSQN